MAFDIIATDPDEIRRLQKGLIIPPAQGVVPVKPPLTGEIEFPPPANKTIIDGSIAPDAPKAFPVEPIRGGGKWGKRIAAALGAAAVTKELYDYMNQEPTGEAEPVAEPEDIEVGGTAALKWSPQQPMDLSMLDEKWEDVREDRMGSPESRGVNAVGGTKWKDLDTFLEWERGEEVRERTKPGFGMQRERDAMGGGPLYSDMSDMERWAEREEADNSEKGFRTEWAHEKQALRNERKLWQMKESMPEGGREAFDALPETTQQKLYAKWYTDQRKAGMNPGDFEENVMLNQMKNRMGDKFLEKNPIVALNQNAEGKRLEHLVVGKARTAKFKEDQRNAKDHYNNQQGLRRLFPNMPYAQGIQMARMLDTAMSPDASLEMKQDAYNFLSQRGVLPETNVYGNGGGGGNEQTPVTQAEIEAAAKREEMATMGYVDGREISADEVEQAIYDSDTPIGDRYEQLVQHIVGQRGVTGVTEDGASRAEALATQHMLDMTQQDMKDIIVDPGFDLSLSTRGQEAITWLSNQFAQLKSPLAAWTSYLNDLDLAMASEGIDPRDRQKRIKDIKSQIKQASGVEVASNDLGLGEAPVIA